MNINGRRINVVIADDHPVVRMGLRQVIQHDPRIRILHEAENGRQALEAILTHEPHVAVLDIEMPEMSGIDVLRAIRKEASPTRVIVLTIHDNETIFESVVELGAMGYILKDSAMTDILRAIHRVAEGEYHISSALSAEDRALSVSQLDELQLRLQGLTPTERRVLGLIARNHSSSEIAERLHVSPRTVTHHRENICGKLELHGSHALLRFALENNTLIMQQLAEQ